MATSQKNYFEVRRNVNWWGLGLNFFKLHVVTLKNSFRELYGLTMYYNEYLNNNKFLFPKYSKWLHFPLLE